MQLKKIRKMSEEIWGIMEHCRKILLAYEENIEKLWDITRKYYGIMGLIEDLRRIMEKYKTYLGNNFPNGK